MTCAALLYTRAIIQKKKEEYAQYINLDKVRLVHFAVEVYGALGPSALAFLRDYARRVAQLEPAELIKGPPAAVYSRVFRQLLERVSIGLQFGLAHSIAVYRSITGMAPKPSKVKVPRSARASK